MGVYNKMGDFGGLSDTYKYYEFELDALDWSSAFAAEYAPTDWPLFTIGGKRPLQNIAAIKLLEIQIPFSFYIYNQDNNTFVFEEAAPFNGPVTVTIPEGNYNVSEMETVLAAAINAVRLSALVYTVTADTNTQKLVIKNNSGGVSLPFTMTFGSSTDTGNSNPRLYLGFTRGATTSIHDVGVTDYIIAPNAYSITGPNYVYVNSDKLGNLCNLFLPRGAFNLGYGNAGPQLAKIPLTVQPGGVVFWSDPDPGKWFDLESLPSLTDVDFYLTMGNTSNKLRMNGQNFSIKLGILENELSSQQSSLGSAASRVTKRIRSK